MTQAAPPLATPATPVTAQACAKAPISRTVRIARGAMLLGFMAFFTIAFAVMLGNWWLLVLLVLEALLVECVLKTFSSIFQKPMDPHFVP